VRPSRFQSLLAGTALGVALALSANVAVAQNAQNNDGVPVPDTAQVAPPTAKDITPSPAPAAALPETPAKPVTAEAPAEPPKPAAEAKPVETKPAEAKTETASAPANTDAMVSDRLRELVTGKLDRIVPRKNERSAVEAFYKERNYAPLWISNGAATAKAKAAIDYLATVDRDGLEPSDYPTPDFKSAADPQSLADADASLTAAILTYARHAANGRVAYSRVSADIFFEQKMIEPSDVLKKVADGNEIAATLDGFEPQFAEYQKLKKALADLRAGKVDENKVEAKATPRVHVPEGKTLRPGMKDERVAALRKRLDVAGDKDNTRYDDAVRDAVKTFQASADLHTDGNLGANTVKAMNGEQASAPAPKLGNAADTIIVNMDRWRWYQRDLGKVHVVVNIPDFRLTLWKDDAVYWTTKIVVGLPGKATPLISAEMKFITVNPTWNVPPSIIEKEYLPALQEDPQALDRIGLKVEQAPDGTVRIWQPPGAGNALGRIRFNFPNKFLVYQHDTPDKHLFAKEKRAFSHGCMRVQDPLVYGEKILSLVQPDEHYTAARLEKMFGGSEININFPNDKFIPVHLTYQTAFVDDAGKLQLREDVYGRDGRMIAILKGERKVADIPVERAPNSSSRPVRMTPGLYGGARGNDGGFFEWVFGGGGPRGGATYQRRSTSRERERIYWR
jgi:murein L,D-transpeptidase YcbB/YkuD